MKVFYFDTETSGLDCKRHGILTLSAIIEIDDKIVGSFDLHAHPEGLEIDQGALDINGLTMEQIQAFPSRESFLIGLRCILSRYVDKFDRNDKFFPCAYNGKFDIDFLMAEFERQGDKYYGSWFNHSLIDPLYMVNMMRYMGHMEDLPNRKLTTIADYYGIDTIGAHTAHDDVVMLREIVQAMKKTIHIDSQHKARAQVMEPEANDMLSSLLDRARGIT